jgi:shikimate dehydrogenase
MASDMRIKDIPLAGVLGDPVAHSLSPRLHGHWLRRYKLPGHYVPMRVQQSDLSDVLRALPLMGFKGVNVTIPHKEHVLSFADSVTDRAALIGAANTLTFTAQGRIQADNTDGIGVSVQHSPVDPRMDRRAGPRARIGKWRRLEGDRVGSAE